MNDWLQNEVYNLECKKTLLRQEMIKSLQRCNTPIVNNELRREYIYIYLLQPVDELDRKMTYYHNRAQKLESELSNLLIKYKLGARNLKWNTLTNRKQTTIITQ